MTFVASDLCENPMELVNFSIFSGKASNSRQCDNEGRLRFLFLISESPSAPRLPTNRLAPNIIEVQEKIKGIYGPASATPKDLTVDLNMQITTHAVPEGYSNGPPRRKSLTFQFKQGSGLDKQSLLKCIQANSASGRRKIGEKLPSDGETKPPPTPHRDGGALITRLWGFN
jgi:hypothetical protein